MIGTIKKIGYAGYLSVDFPTFTLITDCNIDNSDNGESSSYLNREPVSSERYDGSYSPTYRYKWSEKFAPKVTFFKDDFSEFLEDEVRSVLRWLTAKSTASYADFYDDINSAIIKFSALGGWTDIQVHKLNNASVIGITATFSALTPYAVSGLQSTRKIINGTQTFIIHCDSDEQEELTYPKIITTTTGNLTIQNTTLHTTTLVKNNGTNEIITLDGTNQVIGTNIPGRVFGSDFSWNWMPLQRGDNVIQVTGNCTIEFQFRNIIKLGEW